MAGDALQSEGCAPCPRQRITREVSTNATSSLVYAGIASSVRPITRAGSSWQPHRQARSSGDILGVHPEPLVCPRSTLADGLAATWVLLGSDER